MVMTAAETQILLYYQHLFNSKIMIAKFQAMYNCWWSEN